MEGTSVCAADGWIVKSAPSEIAHFNAEEFEALKSVQDVLCHTMHQPLQDQFAYFRWVQFDLRGAGSHAQQRLVFLKKNWKHLTLGFPAHDELYEKARTCPGRCVFALDDTLPGLVNVVCWSGERYEMDSFLVELGTKCQLNLSLYRLPSSQAATPE